MRFARRLLAGTVAVLLVTVLVLVVYAERSLRSDLERDVRGSLESEARLLGVALPADSAAWPSFVTRFGAGAGLRITLIDRTGRVRADTDVPPAELATVENHAGRPEVRAALAGGVGGAKRRSATIGSDLMYVAVAGGPGVVRVALPLDQVDAVVTRSQRSVVVAALIALVPGVLLAWAAGRSIARPLTETAEAARAIAAGAEPRFPHSGIPDVEAMVGALRGMHEELDARFDALRRKQAETEALVNAMVEGVLSCDVRGRVLTANPAARRLLGYPADRAIPELQMLFHHKAAREAVDATLRGEKVPDREVLLDERTCLLSARPLPGGGAVVVLHDLTDVRRLETVRRDFVANVSHELKTPLTSITGYAETLLTDRPDEPTSRKFLETILTNSRRMQRLVDDQLDLSRIESGHWRPAPRRVAAEPALRDAWEAIDLPSRARHAFAVAVAPGAEALMVDPEALRQVLANLYDNARRYTPEGGRITAAAAPEDGGIRVSVRDTGSGIGWDHLPRIFERFYRADPSRSRAEGGTGLGLAIVKHLVEAHGGRVWAESSLGEGTTICCWFPSPSGA
ncbi:MAG TPA: ATP-binding protein [Gemmatimonadales bacterium]|jgi:two-component system phosphate regulon sensor histidine kinase PhoR|nr:ATP-binding protein [Gemmatimonadales bacterium]